MYFRQLLEVSGEVLYIQVIIFAGLGLQLKDSVPEGVLLDNSIHQ